MAILKLDESNFDQTINSGSVVLVDFWAAWCGPCKLIAPILEEVEGEVSGKAVVGKVNVDENESLSRKYGIMSIPSLFVFKDGKVIDKMVGLPRDAKSAIINLIERNY